MQFDSIKFRLLLMTLICALGMGMLVVNQHIINQQLLSLNTQRDALLRLKIDLLQLRRHEKDFLLRRDMRYVNQFSQGIEAFNSGLLILEPLYTQYELDVSKTTELAETAMRYKELFEQVVTIGRTIGLDSQRGLRADFDDVVLRLTTQTRSQSALLNLSEAQLALRDLLLNNDMKHAAQFNAAVSQLQPQAFNYSAALQDIDLLSNTFMAFAELLQQMGETESEGLRGEFRRQAHLLESRLASIDDKLTPVINEQEERVRLYSLLIAIATCSLLVFVLLKSFATFHRAFSYFVMFFYQCKREFQRIDPKKLGFAEFKSLAELANEMVEARKDAESQLAEAKRQLKEQKGS